MAAQLLTVLGISALACYGTVTPSRKCLILWVALLAATLCVITWYLASIP